MGSIGMDIMSTGEISEGPLSSGNQPVEPDDSYGLTGHEPDEPEGTEGELETEPEGGEPSEEDVAKLDLTESENVARFRSSYDKLKNTNTELTSRITELENQIAESATKTGETSYISTDMPLEDYTASLEDNLRRMSENDPEYFEPLAETIHRVTFWPNLASNIKQLEGQRLDPNDEFDAMRRDQITEAWDALAKRMMPGWDGTKAFLTYRALLHSPGLANILAQRMIDPRVQDLSLTTHIFANEDAALLQGMNGTGNGTGQQPLAGPVNPNTIAVQYGLDPSDEGHKAIIGNFVQSQSAIANLQKSLNDERLNNQTTISRLQAQIDDIKKGNGTRDTAVSEDTVKQAEAKVDTLLAEALTSDVTKIYGNAIPKTMNRDNTLARLSRSVKAFLAEDADYQKSVDSAKKWYRQAAQTSDQTRAESFRQKGIAALAVATARRNAAIAQEGKDLIGEIPKKVQAKNQQTQKQVNKAREVRGGAVQPPQPTQTPAKPGDIMSVKANIRKRAMQNPEIAKLLQR